MVELSSMTKIQGFMAYFKILQGTKTSLQLQGLKRNR